SAVTAPVWLHLHVDLDVLVLLVREQNAAAPERMLRADDDAVRDVIIRRDAVMIGLAHVPAGEILAVEDGRESCRYVHLRRLDGSTDEAGNLRGGRLQHQHGDQHRTERTEHPNLLSMRRL